MPLHQNQAPGTSKGCSSQNWDFWSQQQGKWQIFCDQKSSPYTLPAVTVDLQPKPTKKGRRSAQILKKIQFQMGKKCSRSQSERGSKNESHLMRFRIHGLILQRKTLLQLAVLMQGKSYLYFSRSLSVVLSSQVTEEQQSLLYLSRGSGPSFSL